jgi:hypothetical protein
MPGISDHNIVLVDESCNAKRYKKPQHNILMEKN